MTVHHDRTAESGRSALLSAAVSGFFTGTSRALAAWVISLFAEKG